ncbi:hypothetical protein ABFB09_05995 [Dehalogenimonas sp. THU2]|uniref:hypothetical protein n=1 Tax=Dehalogenimonas sp. THU2 TaxID=3151121 RepID=UPI0032184EB9
MAEYIKPVSRRRFVKGVTVAGAGIAMFGLDACVGDADKSEGQPEDDLLHFQGFGKTAGGEWDAEAAVSAQGFKSGDDVELSLTLMVPNSMITALAQSKILADGFCLLVTAERSFDFNGIQRLPSDEKMSTLITPTGLAIEGGVQGAVTKRYGYTWKTPVDEYVTVPMTASTASLDERKVDFTVKTTMPADIPPGIYRLRLDLGVTAQEKRYSMAGYKFATRPSAANNPAESHFYSPPIRVSGTASDGRPVDATAIKPRIPWTLLSAYNSNGYAGVVADEDKPNFALSPRTIIPDDVILPMYGDDNKTVASYSLEPRFPTQTIEARNGIPLNNLAGELALSVNGPDGQMVDLGKAQFTGKAGDWPTTKNPTFTAWKPWAYGDYIVKAAGFIVDTWGNRYEGGGTYHFTIAKRMTLATATFQGHAFAVGGRYGRDLGFAPAVPAEVKGTATLFVNSNPADKRTITFSGTASPSGLFTAAQGNAQLILDAPGEYAAYITARYTDQEGHLWACSMRHAGIVYPTDSSIVAHGKKLTISGKYVDRGETHFEGYVDSDGENHLAHINFPYNAGDVLLIGSEQQGANKIEPMLLYDIKAKPFTYEAGWQTIGATNVQIKTSNGLSPHLFPEYITDRAYFYGAAPRPGFMSRFIVGENGVKAPYWPVSPNSFGGQINASSNGDLPGTIYRLIGGVAVFNQDEPPAYAGYLASSFVMPGKSNNNRVIAAGSEDLLGADGTRARLFMVSIRPGMTYETGASFTPVAQIDPVLPAAVKFTLTRPDGRVLVAENTGDAGGSFVGKEKWILDIPGVYTFFIEADWQGNKGYMPGLPKDGGKIFVVEREQLPQSLNLRLVLPEQTVFAQNGSMNINGLSTGSEVHYAAVTPGAVTIQGVIPVKSGKFNLVFDPAVIAQGTPLYDIKNLKTGKPEVKRVIHLTLFSREKAADGTSYHSFVRLIIRGTTVLYTY